MNATRGRAPGKAAGRSRRHAGVRLTTSLSAALVVAVALVVGGVLLVVLLKRDLTVGLRTATLQRAQDIAAALGNDGLDRVSLSSPGAERSVAQVLLGDRVVLSSPDISGNPPLTSLRPAAGTALQNDTGRLPIDDDEDHRVVAVGVRAPAGPAYVVVVAQSLGSVSTTLTALTALLAGGIPVLVLLVGSSTFLLTGRALRPVEAIRRQVAAIDARRLGQRVPVPAAQDEVGRLAVTMNSMLERLQSGAAGQRRFVSDASHELRSPLANVRATIEVARAHPEPLDWQRVCDVVLDETGRLQSLVDDLLLLANDDEHGLHLRRGDVDLDDLLRLEADRLRRDGRLRVTASLDPVRVDGDQRRLERVLRNVVDNAARHARHEVRLAVHRSISHADIEVTDDGDGILPQDRQRVFERFVRLDPGRGRNAGGTGLGLAIVRQLVRAHGGTVNILEPAGGGTTVRIVLPLTAS